MAKKVEFYNKCGQMLHVEFGERNNFIHGVPECFDNEFDGHAKLALIDIYGMIFPDGDSDKKPIMYFRHTDIGENKYRFGNLVELGDDWLSVQKGVYHVDEIATPDTPVIPYGKMSDDPEMYGFGSDEKLVEARFYENRITMKEGDFLNVTLEPWKYTIYDHQSTYPKSSVVFQPSTFIGSYEGKPIMGVGSCDRFCVRSDVDGFGSIPFEYITLSAAGIREDGRKELIFITTLLDGSGKTVVYYALDGEIPITTDRVTMEAEWKHLPYVDDGTCIFKDAVFYFCDKEIHFEGKWGSKGFLKEPRIEKHGQSQVFGTWYEGKTPYKHRVYYTFVENMGAYDYKLKELGFDVVD